jgi:hypothetical protein
MYVLILLLGAALLYANRHRLLMLGSAFAQVVAGMCLALALGVLFGTMAGKSSATEAGYAALFTLILAFPCVWLLGRLGPAPPAPAPPAAAAPDRRRFWQRAAPGQLPGQLPGQTAWETLQRAAPEQSARISVARRSASRLLAASAGPNPPPDPGELASLIKKHVPPAIDSALAEAATQQGAARLQTLETLVETLEDIAAEAERLMASRSGSREGNRDVALLRRRLQAMERRGPV